YGPDARVLIVSGDGLGLAHSANVAVYDALRDGIATSAGLMVPCAWSRDASATLPTAPVPYSATGQTPGASPAPIIAPPIAAEPAAPAPSETPAPQVPDPTIPPTL
ncbi:ChbG/HpnK family deacetylase, partial [Phenylobacterium sp.]|uniref:ChbG/HpnK family deacetylase n=1 Tax=Phenylobacterium sp. TaxID=1871053 RepID=UPI002FC95D7E